MKIIGAIDKRLEGPNMSWICRASLFKIRKNRGRDIFTLIKRSSWKRKENSLFSKVMQLKITKYLHPKPKSYNILNIFHTWGKNCFPFVFMMIYESFKFLKKLSNNKSPFTFFPEVLKKWYPQSLKLIWDL
jgi:hypothetical protein